MYKRLGTRGRAVFVTILMAVVIFVVGSPIASNAYELLFPPAQVSNIKVEQKNNEIDLTWNKNLEGDLGGYVLTLNNTTVNVDKDTTTYSFYKLTNGTTYTFSIIAKDTAGKTSIPFSTNVQPQDKIASQEYNIPPEINNSRTIILTALALAAFLLLLNLWVLFFKVNKSTFFTIAAFPSFALVPFLIFSFTLIASLTSFTNKLILSLGVVVAFAFGNYLLLLTSNILNGSINSEIPLLQAGKASQFIFSLISTYLILIYAFGSFQDFFTRILISLPFIMYFSYSSIWMNKNISLDQVLIRSIAITLIMFLTLGVLSIWPIESVYAILAASVIFYVLLNVALEIRKTLDRTVWIEYGILTLLILVLLFTNGSWGINGTII